MSKCLGSPSSASNLGFSFPVEDQENKVIAMLIMMMMMTVMIMMMIVMSKYFDEEDFSYRNKDVAPSYCILNFF